jgi:predicted nucleotidyltransferase
MHINPGDTISGIRVIKLRDFLRKSGQSVKWREEYISSSLHLHGKQTLELLAELENRGYIEKDEFYDGQQYWHNTIRGNALGGASAAKPYKRTTAEKALGEFMGRVQKVNSDPYYLYKVTRVVVFGSYLTGAPEVSDVDLALDITPKEKDLAIRSRQLAKRREDAEKSGKRFNNIAEWAGAAELEIWSFLKSRSRIISLHLASGELQDLVGGKMIFDEGKLL